MVTSHGETEIYSYYRNKWVYVALVDGNGNEVTRINIIEDGRTYWNYTDTSDTPTLVVRVTGADADISRPVTFTRLELYKTTDSTQRLTTDTIEGANRLDARYDSLCLTTTLST